MAVRGEAGSGRGRACEFGHGYRGIMARRGLYGLARLGEAGGAWRVGKAINPLDQIALSAREPMRSSQ